MGDGIHGRSAAIEYSFLTATMHQKRFLIGGLLSASHGNIEKGHAFAQRMRTRRQGLDKARGYG